VIVVPRSGLGDAALRSLGGRLRRLAVASGMRGVRLRVAGAPLVVAAMAREVPRELLRLAPIAALAMIVTLAIGFRGRRRRLRPLVLAGGAVLVTTGLSYPLGLGLTPASVAALPVVLGLAVDYAAQLQARYWAERSAGLTPQEAGATATRRLAPTLLLATTAMVAGFLSLTLSPVPLVDRLGEMLALGAAVSLVVTLTFAAPLYALGDRLAERPLGLVLDARVVRLARRPGVLAVAVGAALAGLVLSGQTPVESDLTKLAPSGMSELRQIKALQSELGTSGQLRIAITAPDVTDPQVLAWMGGLGGRVLALDARLKPGPNLAQLLAPDGEVADRASIQRLLGVVPPYFLGAVLTPNHRRAELSFGVPLMPVDQQARLIGRVGSLLVDAPPGVQAKPAGLIAEAARSIHDLQGGRPWLLLAAAALVLLVLGAASRALSRAALPLVPALLAAGISALAVRALGLRLSPLAAGLEPLVLAVGTEFGLLLQARYREARLAGATPGAARAEAVARVGGAVAVSAACVAVGFGTLLASRLELLRQLGGLVALELALSAAMAIVLVPILAEAWERRPHDLPGPRGIAGRSAASAGLRALAGRRGRAGASG